MCELKREDFIILERFSFNYHLMNGQWRNEHLPTDFLLIDGQTPQLVLSLLAQVDPVVLLML